MNRYLLKFWCGGGKASHEYFDLDWQVTKRIKQLKRCSDVTKITVELLDP